jgi:hypothetical protein
MNKDYAKLIVDRVNQIYAESGSYPAQVKAVLDAFQEIERGALRQAAKVVIERTRIPEDALKRGTGVRDHVVILGEELADRILRSTTAEEEESK